MLHPLPTMIQSQRNQIRREHGRPAPQRRSTTEENAIAAQPARGHTALIALVILLVAMVAALALV